MSYPIIVAAVLAVCFGIQSLALKSVGGRTVKSESNFFSSLGRIQAGTVGTPEVMLLGSSLTGRLPDRAQGFAGFANMGCDGGSAVDSLRAMDRKILPVAPVLVIEANTLVRAISPVRSEIGQAMTRPWFQIGMRVPALSAYARPSAFFYSVLLARRIGEFGTSANGLSLDVSSRPATIDATPQIESSGAEEKLVGELVPLLKQLQARGCRIVFVWLPPGRQANSPLPGWIAQLISKSGCEWWDLGNEADPYLITLTDSVHMSAPSAARTVVSLSNGLGLK